MRQVIYWLAKYTGLFALCRQLTKKHIRILAYHGIWLGEEHFGNFLFMNPEKFSRRMSKLNKMGVVVLPLAEALSRQQQGSLPNTPVVLTIDDGWYGTYLHMLPALERYAFPATVYVTSYYCDKQLPVLNVVIQYMVAQTKATHLDLNELTSGNIDIRGKVVDLSLIDEAILVLQKFTEELECEADRQGFITRLGEVLGVPYSGIIHKKLFHLMSSDNIVELCKRGIDVQLHTHRHRSSRGESDCLAQEIQDNRDWLEPLLDSKLTDFCYPSGVFGESDWPALESAGIRSATTKIPGLAGKQHHRYALPRIMDGQNVSDLEFEAEISGFGQIKRALFG